MRLPPARSGTGTPYRVALVCLGNICRSPMAATVLRRQLAYAGLATKVEVTSAGTGDWHVGEPMDRRAAATLSAAGYDPTGHRARQFGPDWLDQDLVLVMDASNLRDVRAIGGTTDRVRMFRDFDPVEPGSDVPDPWTAQPGGHRLFDEVLSIVERTCGRLVRELTSLLDPDGADRTG